MLCDMLPSASGFSLSFVLTCVGFSGRWRAITGEVWPRDIMVVAGSTCYRSPDCVVKFVITITDDFTVETSLGEFIVSFCHHQSPPVSRQAGANHQQHEHSKQNHAPHDLTMLYYSYQNLQQTKNMKQNL